MPVHLFGLKQTSFVLWRPARTAAAPKLVIGEFSPGNPPTLANRRDFVLALLPGTSDLWGIAASACGLTDGNVYYYWFEVTDDSPTRNGSRILCTDPTAFTVDWRLQAERLPPPYKDEDQDPAAVIKFKDGKLVPCDAAGETFAAANRIASGKPNNQIVIYELPTSWSKINVSGNPQIGVGTFRDVLALVDAAASAPNFAGHAALRVGRSHLQELGINALELLPIADSFVEREWGYATSNYLAPDYDLGFPSGNSSPTSNTDLIALVNACHALGIRFVIDVVMAFGTRAPLENINFTEFHIDPTKAPNNDPDRLQSSRNNEVRDGFGGKLWRYAHAVSGYDPISGDTQSVFPARQLMKAYLLRWMADFGVDGIRMDSVNNIANWDFVQEFKDLARKTWHDSGGSDDTIIVVGEELAIPLDLLDPGNKRLDGLWNEPFKRMVRNAILGHNDDQEPSFEQSVRKLIDCRLIGFHDGAEAVNYVGSHDVEGFRNERLYNFLDNNGIFAKEERVKLAFACLLTAVGIPMILAGDEFADQHDLSTTNPDKQQDAVNFGRLDEPFRRRIFDYVSRLVKFRTSYQALSVNDTDFIHVDFNDGKRVLVWHRGQPGSEKQVVVVANFSDFDSGRAGSDEYRVPNWPGTPPGKHWREITQERDIPPDWVAREAIFPWEAKVYALV
jgi:1,4-alpha-glucan branching enzyme